MLNSSGIKHPAEAFFSRESHLWEKHCESRTYCKRRGLVGEIVQAEVVRLNRAPGTIQVLDFGCGGGILLKDVADLDVQVTGVDSSKAMLNIAQERLALSEQVKMEWLQNDSGIGSYESGSYDIVLCLSVLEFVPEMNSLLARLCRRVSAGGMLVVSVPNRRSWLRRVEGFIHRHPANFQRLAIFDHLTGSDSYLHHQYHQFTRDELLRIMTSYGMRHEMHRFHVAPSFLRATEVHERIGMMLLAVFRKA